MSVSTYFLALFAPHVDSQAYRKFANQWADNLSICRVEGETNRELRDRIVDILIARNHPTGQLHNEG